MAKVKLNLSLDKEIKTALEQYAKEQHMTVSALITAYVLKLPTAKQVIGQMDFEEVEKEQKKQRRKES